jgi:hypothetical protein
MKFTERLRGVYNRRRHYPEQGLVVVGSGPFRLPGEARRVKRAAAEARRIQEAAEQAEERG